MDSLMTYRKTNLKLYYMNRFNFIPFIFLVFLCLCSCNQETKENAEATATVKELPPDKQAEVTIAPLVYTDFEHELVSNGKKVKYTKKGDVVTVTLPKGMKKESFALEIQ